MDTPSSHIAKPAITTHGARRKSPSTVKPDASVPAPDRKDRTFLLRKEFHTQMHSQLDDSSQVLDRLTVRLQALRDQVRSLRNQLDASLGTTASTWDEAMAGFDKSHSEFHDDLRNTSLWSDTTVP